MWKINKHITVLFMTLVLNSLHKIQASPTKQVVVQVPFGETVTLVCDSNDAKHSFIFWFVNEKNIFVGPSYHYDNAKFKYEVLSGNLTVKAVSKDEEGVYNCVSRGVSEDTVNIRSVRMVVKADWEEVYEHDPNNCSENKIEENTLGKFTYFKERISGAIFGFIVPNLSKICRKVKEKRDEIKEFIEEQGFPHREHNIDCPIKKIGFDKKITALKVNLYRVVIVLGTLMVISGVGYAGYKIWKNRFRHPAYLVPSEDEDDDSGDEIFRAPGTSRGVENASMVKTQSTESFSTDFKSILDTANNK